MSIEHSDLNIIEEKNEFKEKEEQKIPVEEEKVSAKEFEDLATDKVKQRLDRKLEMDADSVFQERYSEIMVSDSVIEKRVVKKVERVYRNKSWGIREKTKRKEEAKKRINLQRSLRGEQKKLIAVHEEKAALRKNSVNRADLDKIRANFLEEDERQAALLWMLEEPVKEQNKSADDSAGFFLPMINSAEEGKKAVLKAIPDLFEKTKFSYKTDEEFANNYAAKYDILSRIAAAEPFLRGMNLNELETGHVQTCILLSKKIKTHYERKMSLLESEYYALTRESDIEKFKGNNSEAKMNLELRDQGFKDYIRKTLALRKESLAKGIEPGNENYLQEEDTYAQILTARQQARQVELIDSKSASKELLDNAGEDPDYQDFVKSMSELLGFLEQKMPPAGFDKEAFEASCALATALYIKLDKVITETLDKSIPIQQKNQLQKLKKVCDKERTFFKSNVADFREAREKSALFRAENKDATWMDAVKYQRAAKFNLDEDDDVELNKMGDSTSVIYRLTKEKNGKKETVFFSETEKVPAADNRQMIKDFYKHIKADRNVKELLLKPVFEAIDYDMANDDINGLNTNRFFESFRRMEDNEIVEALVLQGTVTGETLKEYSKEDRQVVLEYVREFSKKVFQRTMCTGIGINNGSDITGRNVATSRIAEFLGISNIICDSKTAVVKEGDSYKVGNIMEESKGIESKKLRELADKRGCIVRYTPKAIGQLFSLQVFDLMCCQVDRHFANYHVTYVQKGDVIWVNGIRGFDNDMSFGRVSFNILKKGYNRVRPLDEVEIMGLPVEFLNAVMNLKKESLPYIFGDLLNSGEIVSFWKRTEGIQNFVKTMVESGLIKQDGFGRYYYEGEDADDSIRMMKQLRRLKGGSSVKLQAKSVFYGGFVSTEDLDYEINERRAKLQKDKKF